jgi:SAM-dependent methyltransferase
MAVPPCAPVFADNGKRECHRLFEKYGQGREPPSCQPSWPDQMGESEVPLNLQLVRHDLACIDVTTMRGLEIGPLAAPRVRKDEGDIFYVDHTDAEGLRRKYATNSVLKDSLHQIVDIDRVIEDGLGVREAVADLAPFDYVIASHLIEHIPDPVTWLSDIASLLRPSGILSLVIPDKRFTFDFNRRTTEISDLVDAYLRRLHKPSFRQAYDFISKEITEMVDPAAVWAGTADFTGVVRSDVPDPDVAALQLCRTIAGSDEYVDVHCSVFTPDSFLDLCDTLARVDLIEFEVAHFVPTEVNQLEFHVSLRRSDVALDREAARELQLGSIRRARRSSADPAVALHAATTTPAVMEVSDLERTLLHAKRRILGTMRTAQARLRVRLLVPVLRRFRVRPNSPRPPA